MYFDALTLAALADELRGLLVGGRVQRVVRPSELSIGLEVYAGRRYQLLLSAEASSPAISLADLKVRRGTETPSPLQLLLVKYIKGSKLVAITQPPLERVLRLNFDGEFGPVGLVAELMGRYSNLILVGIDNRIMDAAKRIPASLNRYRTILPKQPYVPPPPQNKLSPLMLTPGVLLGALGTEAEMPVWQRLVEAFGGISPLLAREITFRALGDAERALPVTRAEAGALQTHMEMLLALPESRNWEPCVAYEDDEDRRPFAFAPYTLTHLPLHEAEASISSAIRRVDAARTPQDAYRVARTRLHILIHEQIERQNAKLASLCRSLVGEEQIEELQLKGNAILALAWSITPGQQELEVAPEMVSALSGRAEAEPLRISLDPTLAPSDNAQKLFHSYRKLKSAAEEVPQLIAGVEDELTYLRQLDTEVDLAEDRAQLDEVEGELRAAGYAAGSARARPGRASQPLSLRAEDGTLILVGRNSRQNEELTFRRATPDDTWLHAHALPGAHVIVKNSGRPLSDETLRLAAQAAAYYSAGRGESHVQVDYTPRRYVRHIPNARPGMVTYREEQTLVVEPEAPAGAADWES